MIFPEVHINQPSSFEDFRGELFTSYKKGDFNLDFNHDKVSISRKNVLRGLHGDSKSWKLITCLSGEVMLVVVDNRNNSPNYLKWDSIILTEKNKKDSVLEHIKVEHESYPVTIDKVGMQVFNTN